MKADMIIQLFVFIIMNAVKRRQFSEYTDECISGLHRQAEGKFVINLGEG
jgi:hypothetical protein